MFLLPFGVDFVGGTAPIANWVMILLNVAVGVMQFTGKIHDAELDEIIYGGWNPLSMIASCFLHGGWDHLIGNMLFLWTFGNPVCAAIGNLRFVLAYLLLAWFSSAISYVAYDNAGIGASGAINGIVGMYLVLFPLNSVSCFWFVFYRWGVVEVAGFWLVLLWFGFDVLGAIGAGDEDVGYWAHISGLVGGIALGFLVDWLRWTLLDPEEQCSIMALATGRNERLPKGAEHLGKSREQLTRELNQAGVVRRPPPRPEDDAPIPMD